MDLTQDSSIFKKTLAHQSTGKLQYAPRPTYEFRLKNLRPFILEQVDRYNLTVDDIAEALDLSHRQVLSHLRDANGLKSVEQYERTMKLCLEARARKISVLELMTIPGETPTGNRRKLPAYTAPVEEVEESDVGTIVPVQFIEVEKLDWVLGACLTFLGGVVGAFLSQVYL
jgi:DNA-binding transcriptional ArsR family regulator